MGNAVQEDVNSPVSKTVVLLIVVLGSFLVVFMATSINVALPSIGGELSMDPVLLSWVAMAYLLASAMFCIPFGRAGDILGRKRVYLWGIFIYTVSSLLCGLASSGRLLISLRVVQGIGSAMVFATYLAILSSVFTAGERGKALGINIAALSIAASLGPFIGGILTQHLGWRSVFFVNVPLGLMVIAITSRALRGEWADARGERFDFVGSAVYSLSLVGIMYGISQLPGISGASLILVGGVAMAGFVVWESRVEFPVLRLELFTRNRAFVFSNLAALISFSAIYAVGFLLSLYLQQVKGLSPQVAGTVLLAQAGLQAVVSPFAGRLSDRVASRVVSSIGMALMATALGLFAFLGTNTSLTFVLAGLALLGGGFGLFSSPNMNAVMSAVEPSFYGLASATRSTVRTVGQVLSLAIATALLATYMGRVEIAPENYQLFLASTRTSFLIFAALCFGGIFASLQGDVH